MAAVSGGTKGEWSVVGRDDELAVVRAFLSRTDPGGALVIRGSPGIGKTTLWRIGVDEARERGFRALTTRPSEAEAQLSLAGLGDVLDGIDLGDLPELAPALRAALDVALLRAAPGAEPPEPRVIGVAVLEVLRGLAREGPVLVAIDDSQWLDPASTAAVAFAARRLGGSSVALLLAKRSGADTPLVDEVSEAGLEWVDIGGLSLGAVRRILVERLGLSLPRSELRRLHDAARGNPMFALELGRIFLDRGSVSAIEPLPVSDDLRVLIGDRVSALPGPSRELLLAASLLARPDAETLRRALGRAIDDDLAPAERAGIVLYDGNEVVLAHPLYASAIVLGATVADRRRMHGLLASVSPSPEERARHVALAVEGRDEGSAVTIEAAARDVFRRGLPAAAAELMELAGEIGEPDGRRSSRRLLQATYAQCAGDARRARAALEPIDGWSRAPADVQARAYGQLLVAVYWTDGAAAACELGERMLADDLPPEVRASIHAHLSGFNEVDFERAAEHSAAALALLSPMGDRADPMLLARAVTFDVRNRLVLGHGFEREAYERVVELERRAAEGGDTIERVSFNFANWFKHFDDLDTSRLLLEQRLEQATAVQEELTVLATRMHLGLTECWAGRLHLALEHLREAERIVDDLGARNVGIVSMTALVQAHLGDETAVRSLAATLRAQEGEPTGREAYEIFLGAALGLLELSLGDHAAADGHLSAVLAALEEGSVGEPGIFRVHANAAEAAVGVGDLERADEIAASLASHAERTGHRWSRAVGLRASALVLAARGELDAARNRADAALAAHDGLGMPVERARALLVAGSLERRARQWARARTLLEEAVGELELSGARLWEARAREELASVGGRRRRAEGELTPSERRAAELAARGLSNKEIAHALSVTVHTVERHLSNVYAKLGIRGRSQLPRHVAVGE